MATASRVFYASENGDVRKVPNIDAVTLQLAFQEPLVCDESLVEAWALGLKNVPPKTAKWLNTLAAVHEAAERDRPRPLKGKRYLPPETASSLEHVPVHAYYLLRQTPRFWVPCKLLIANGAVLGVVELLRHRRARQRGWRFKSRA